MIKYSDAQVAFARAIYDLLAASENVQSFSVLDIAKKSKMEVGAAFVGRVLSISQEEDEIFVSDDGGYWTLGKEGFELVEAHELVRVASSDNRAPAANRVVRFNHNSPEAEEIATQIAEIKESVRGVNNPDIDEQERQRVFSALSVAEEIWRSGNFKLIQLKVGIVLAVEDAGLLLAKTTKQLAAAMLVDAVKAFVKNHFHADLDGI